MRPGALAVVDAAKLAAAGPDGELSVGEGPVRLDLTELFVLPAFWWLTYDADDGVVDVRWDDFVVEVWPVGPGSTIVDLTVRSTCGVAAVKV